MNKGTLEIILRLIKKATMCKNQAVLFGYLDEAITVIEKVLKQN